MRKLTLILMMLLTGGFFSGCQATRNFVKDHVKAAIDGALESAKETAGKLVDKGIEKLEEKRKEKRDKEKAKIDAKLAKIEPNLDYDANQDGVITIADFDTDKNEEISPTEAVAITRYYLGEPAKEGEEKNTKGLLLGLGILAVLFGGSQIKKKYDKKKKETAIA